jgi:hypothetical protein
MSIASGGTKLTDVRWTPAQRDDECKQCGAPIDEPWGDEERARVLLVEDCDTFCGWECYKRWLANRERH